MDFKRAIPTVLALHDCILKCVILQHNIFGEVEVRSHIDYTPKREKGLAILEMFLGNII